MWLTQSEVYVLDYWIISQWLSNDISLKSICPEKFSFVEILRISDDSAAKIEDLAEYLRRWPRCPIRNADQHCELYVWNRGDNSTCMSAQSAWITTVTIKRASDKSEIGVKISDTIRFTQGFQFCDWLVHSSSNMSWFCIFDFFFVQFEAWKTLKTAEQK